MNQGGGRGARSSCSPWLSGSGGHCAPFPQPLAPPASEIRARRQPSGHNQNRWLVAPPFPLQGKGTVRWLTFKKTAGRREISTDTFIKCHHFCFSSTLSA